MKLNCINRKLIQAITSYLRVLRKKSMHGEDVGKKEYKERARERKK